MKISRIKQPYRRNILYALILMLLASFTFAPISNAADDQSDETSSATPGTSLLDFYQDNDIIDYRPGDTCVSPAAGSGSLSGGNNQEKIWDWLMREGMSEIGAAGIMGNMEVESGFNPFRLQAGGTYDSLVGSAEYNKAFGLVQWDGSRRVNVLKFIASKNADYKKYISTKYGGSGDSYNNAEEAVLDDFLTIELEFMKLEATPGNDTDIGGSARPTTWDALLEAGSPSEAADRFEEIFEGSVRGAGGPHSVAAERIFNEYSTGAATVSTDSISSGTSTTSDEPACPGDAVDTSIQEGGLNEEQAKKLMMNYGKNANNDTLNTIGASYWASCRPGSQGSNCVSFSRFFLNKFTNSKAPTPMGNGIAVVSNLKAAGVPTGNKPKVFAVFSMPGAGGYGHTGIVLGIKNGVAIVGHASCSRGNAGIGGEGNGTLEGNGSGFIRVGKINTKDPWYAGSVPTEFAYPEGVDVNKIGAYIGGGLEA